MLAFFSERSFEVEDFLVFFEALRREAGVMFGDDSSSDMAS
jgi:hypothetical protein